jgi:hypothetical protein
MSRTFLSGIAPLLVALGVCLFGQRTLLRAEPDQTVSVTAADLASGKVVVIGRLGVPLKTMMTVRGSWRSPNQGTLGQATKPTNIKFDVTHVNGKKLETPVQFDRVLVHVQNPLNENDTDTDRKELAPVKDETWEIRAYETGAFRGRPAEFAKELGVPPDNSRSEPDWGSPFLVEIHGVIQRPTALGKPRP